ncbi:MAG: NAD-dependent succinate-semialdehyde dehydrogenase [Ignavibacteriae bacterium]|nr:NAD-dependent succinate-semialdehyde dehydrogenase [Ignavibacteriota bacterium]
MPIESINPTTNEIIQTYQEHSEAEIELRVKDANDQFNRWRRVSFAERAKPLRAAAAILRERKDEYGKLMALEMGKPLKQGIAEAEKCAWVCEYYAENAEKFLLREIVQTDASKSFITFQPLGILLAIMPWNFPFWQVFRAAAPALMAGNAVVLKHASNVSGCALEIEKIFQDAGLPDGLFTTVLLSSKRVNAIIEHPLVKAVTITGSTAAGKAVAAKAGEMLKKTVLELGGSDPYVVLEDADLDHAVTTCVASRLINNGESCIAAKRFIVVESLKTKFEELFVEKMKAQKVGDPLDPSVTVGPMARHDLRDELHEQVCKSIERGATILCGGEIPDSKGAFYPPTVLTNVKKGMPAYDEELFGPVAAIIGAKDEADAIRLANDSVFGLGAAVFTQDVRRGERIAARELEAGACFVNGLVKSDPRLPFGGIKESGYGRELGLFGIREFVNVKSVWVK